MRNYDVVVVVKSSLAEKDRTKLLDTVKGWLKGLKVTKEEDLGSKALAYPIKKELTGHYIELFLEGDTFPLDFEKRIMEVEEILRHLVIRTK